MLEIILKVLALAGFILFLLAPAIYVPDGDLIAVLAIVVAMAAYDFLVRPAIIRSRRR